MKIDEKGVPDYDMLRFNNLNPSAITPPEGHPVPNVTDVGWAGPWPPPEFLTFAFGTMSGLNSVFDEDQLTDKDKEDLAKADSVVVIRCRRVTHSIIPERVAHVMRVAEYQPRYGEPGQ